MTTGAALSTQLVIVGGATSCSHVGALDIDAAVFHESDGVGVTTIDVDLEMQMATEGASSVTRVSDDLARIDPLPPANEDATGFDVRVPGADAPAVLDADLIAVVAVRAGVVHCS